MAHFLRRRLAVKTYSSAHLLVEALNGAFLSVLALYLGTAYRLQLAREAKKVCHFVHLAIG